MTVADVWLQKLHREASAGARKLIWAYKTSFIVESNKAKFYWHVS